MAQGGISSVSSDKISHRFTRALSSAFFEWLLLFMLFIDAMVSYLITKFAHKCKLQTPCLLCSRLDHVFGKEKLKFYWDLVCDDHKLEISSLVYCNAHNKLVDVHGMCESCLFSFATKNKSNAETYRLLVGKLGKDSESGLQEDPSLENHKLGCSTVRHCSCCNELWMPKGFVRTLMQTQSTVSQAAEFDLPLPVSVENSQDDQNRSGNASVSVRATHQRKKSADLLSHVAYTELKITSDSDSDSESELTNDVGDEEDALIIQTNHRQLDFVDQHVQPESQTFTLSDDLGLKKFMDPVSVPKPSTFTSQSESDIIEPLGAISVESIDSSGHGLEEHNWGQASSKIEPSASSKLISLDDVPLSLKGAETSIDVSTEMNLNSLDKFTPLSNAGEIPIQGSEGSKLISLDFLSSSSLGNETPVELSKKIKQISIDDSKIEPSASSELISLDDVPLSSKGAEASIDMPKERNLNDKVLPLSNAREIPILKSEGSKIISLDFLSSSSLGNETPVEVSREIKHISIDDVSPSDLFASSVEESKESSVMGTLQVEKISVTKCEEICTQAEQPLPMLPESPVEENHVANGNSIQAPNSLDLSDAYKLAVGSKGRQLSGLLVEQWFGKDSSRLSEDLKVLLSQLSARGFEQSTTDASPRVAVSPRILINSDDLKGSDSSTFNGIQILQKRISLERNESGLSIDGSIVSEIEGESVVDRLKRQVEHDRKLLSVLYKELEEERNASAVAANQAMAMITRLQEEKAMLQMEALQNLRMMEEQAEYDMEALQNTNDLLAEKEKEIQDLETELEFYRMKFPNEFMLDDTVNLAYDLQAKPGTVDHSKANGIGEKASIHTGPVSEKPNICSTVEEPDMKNPLPGHEQGYHEELIP